MTTQANVRSAQVVLVAGSQSLLGALAPHFSPRNVRMERFASAAEVRARLLPEDRLPHEAEESPISAVVLDDDIEGGGNGLMAELLSRRPGLRLIWVAGALDCQREIEARRLGVFYIISRPLEPTLLARVISKAIEHETTRLKRG